MRNAIEVAAALITHARAVFELLERDPAFESAAKVLNWIRRVGNDSFTARNCFRAHQSRFMRMDALNPVLDLLEEHGYIRRHHRDSQGGRRPSDIYEVNPAFLNCDG